MAIKFNCPYCGEAYRLKDELSGKKATCRNPACRKTMTIPELAEAANASVGAASASPAPAAPPASPALPGEVDFNKPVAVAADQTPPPEANIDVDAFIASALAEEAPKPTEPPKSISVVCDVCDAKFEVDAEKAGKRVPCPECRHLIKIPELVVEKPKDWRQTHMGIGGGMLKRDQLAELDGVMGGASRGVSAEALVQADAVLGYEPDDPPSKWVRVKQGLLLIGFVCLLAAGYIGIKRLRVEQGQNNAIELAIKELGDEKELAKRQPELSAGIHAGAVEFYARADRPADAKEHLKRAKAMLQRYQGNFYLHDDLALQLALAVTHLGGDKTQVGNELKQSWDDTQKDLREILTTLRGESVLRLFALRRLEKRLIEKQQGGRGEGIARLVFAGDEQAEAIAQIALELYWADQLEDAKKAFATAKSALPAGAKPTPTLHALHAFGDKLGKELLLPADKLFQAPTPAKADPEANARLAWTLLLALQGKTEDARKLATAPGDPFACLVACHALAEVLIEGKDPKPPEARPLFDTCKALIADKKIDPKRVPRWLICRMVVLAPKAGAADAPDVLLSILEKDEPILELIVLDRLRADAASSSEKLADAIVDKLPAETTFAGAIARGIVARHNSRVTGDRSFTKQIDRMTDKGARAFGFAGIALGLQDRTMK